MKKIINLVLAAFCFYLFASGFAFIRMGKWILGPVCLLAGLIGTIRIFVKDATRERDEERRQKEINELRIDQLKEEFRRTSGFLFRIKTRSGELIVRIDGFIAPGKDFITWKEVQTIFACKTGGNSKSEPTPYYILAYVANGERIVISFKSGSEHAMVVEKISKWLWEKQTASMSPIGGNCVVSEGKKGDALDIGH